MDVIVIGGGASGLTAAITAAGAGHNVTVLERQKRVLRKLMATGNGRCNLTNLQWSVDSYHTGSPDILKVFQAFGTEETLRWFSSLGLITVAEDSGRVYPFSDSANSVADVLRLCAEQSGVSMRCAEEVLSVKKRGSRFRIETAENRYGADRVILACGGPAGESVGGTRSGYMLLSSLGHHITPVFPALVQLRCDPVLVRSLKGIRTDCDIRLRKEETVIAETSGEVQFTDYGISGPAVFAISRFATTQPGPFFADLDLMPLLPQPDLEALLYEKAARFPNLTCENLMTGVVHNRLGRVLVQSVGISPDLPLSQLTDRNIADLAAKTKCDSLPITGYNGFADAQVTAGGADSSEFYPETLESRLVPGLYACGEVLDVDGDCGGYNLQWAWSSGRLAGRLLSMEETV